MNALGERIEHRVGRIVHLAAQLVEVLAEAFGVLVVGPQHATGGKRAVAVAEHERAFLEQQRLGAVALGGHRCRSRLTGQAAAHDEHVGFLVPIDLADRLREVVLVGFLALCGASAERGGRGASEHGRARRLDEAATRLRQVQISHRIHLRPFP